MYQQFGLMLILLGASLIGAAFVMKFKQTRRSE
jgi:hypothetical protein